MSDYWKLIRPRILAMVLFAMAVGAWTAGDEPPPWPKLLNALFGSALTIAGAVALNQRLERRSDAKMSRTAGRPLPSGRLSNRQVTWFGLLASAAGLGHLFAWSGPGVLVVAVVSWVIYLGAYTPLKSRTVWQTPVGAVAGAMPVLLGAAVVQAPMSPMAATLFGVVFFWQFPHAMAIAWLYRDQFAAADVKLASVVDPSGRTAGLVAVGGAIALLTVSLIPAFYGLVPWQWQYKLAALWMGHGYMACSFGFLHRRTEATARRLLWASLLYLPTLFVVLLLW